MDLRNVISNWKVRELVDKATNIVMNYTEVEAKVREATNDDPWGPTGEIKTECAQYTFQYDTFPEVMGMLWKRLFQDNKTNWRRVYKGLLLLDHLVRNGSERVVTSAREHIYDLRSLEVYSFIDENGKDQGVNVRQRAKALIELIMDDEKLREERKKAKKNRDKYIGVSSEHMPYISGSYKGSNRYSDNWSDSPSSSRKDSYDDGGQEYATKERSERRSYHDESPADEPRSSNNDDFGDFNSVTSQPRPSGATSPVRSSQPQKPLGTSRPTSAPSGKTGRTGLPREALPKVDLGRAKELAQQNADRTKQTKQPETSLFDIPSSGASAAQTQATVGKSNQDLLNDIFAASNPTPTTEPFADFTSAPSMPPNKASILDDDDEFGEFSSIRSATSTGSAPAMSLNSNPASISPLPPQNPLNLLSSPAPAPMPVTFAPQLSQAPLIPNSANPNLNQSKNPPNSSANKNGSSASSQNNTWSSLASTVNIDVDDLMGTKNARTSAPSMNQLASNLSTVTISPTHRPALSANAGLVRPQGFGVGFPAPTVVQQPLVGNMMMQAPIQGNGVQRTGPAATLSSPTGAPRPSNDFNLLN